MSATKPMKPVTFEAGARAVEEAMRGKGVEGYYADAADPLHAAFPAKARIHSGPDGMPLMGESAREALERLADRPRSGKTLAYLHIPFCETRCLYCMFYQNPFDEDRSKVFTDALIRELELWSDRDAQRVGPVHAVYFGGGTPTALSARDLRRVLDTVQRTLPLANDCEITIEGRINNFDDEKIEAALAGGANRFSLGVQTFNTQVRRSMMRIDDGERCLRRLEALMSYDQAAVVIDLIYGFPGQSMDVWEEDLRIASSLPLDGIDCYQLNVFEKSPLARRVESGKLPPAADTPMKADMFARSVEFLTNANWRRLSNNHWGQGTRERNVYNQLGKGACDCLAFGSGAGGRLFGYSFMLERKLDDYIRAVNDGVKPTSFLMAPGPHWALLRTISSAMESGAINLAAIGRSAGLDLEGMAKPVLDQWAEAGLLRRQGEWLHQTVAGQFWHVTLAQLLIDFLKTQLVAPNAPNAKDAQDGMNGMALRKLDMGAPQMVAAAAGGARALRAPHPHHG